MTDKIKQGDLLPSWSCTLFNAGAVVDLSAATAVRVKALRGSALVIDRVATTATALGVVTLDWLVGDTDEPCRLDFEVEVTWPGSLPQTFPPNARLATTIYQDADGESA